MTRLAADYLVRIKDRFPDRVAVVEGDRRITFRELWDRSVHLGVWIRESFGVESTPVVVAIPLGIDAVVALLGVQLSGNIYVPLDVESPQARRDRALATLGQHLLLERTDSAYRVAGRDYTFSEPASDEERERLERTVVDTLSRRRGSEPLYIMFTSGTTGVPKGVTISNASLIDYIEWAVDTYDVTEMEIIGNQAPLHFDNSCLDLYLMLATGCCLHVLQPGHFLFVPTLMDYLREHEINFIFFVPSVLANVATLDLLSEYELPRLKKILFAGEAMPLGTLRYLHQKLPHATLSNLYGPTEATVDCIYWTFGDEIERIQEVPIGVPCTNARIVFLDDEGRVVQEPDEVAEICVGGPGVALGYWNSPAETRGAFVQNPASPGERDIIYKTGDLGYTSARDGLIYIVGRKDDQIKHMGHRIELGEIESAVMRLPQVTQCNAQYDRDRRLIVTFYSTTDGKERTDLAQRLADELPRYMMPHVFIPCASIPVTSSGKVDRKALWSQYLSRDD